MMSLHVIRYPERESCSVSCCVATENRLAGYIHFSIRWKTMDTSRCFFPPSVLPSSSSTTQPRPVFDPDISHFNAQCGILETFLNMMVPPEVQFGCTQPHGRTHTH